MLRKTDFFHINTCFLKSTLITLFVCAAFFFNACASSSGTDNAVKESSHSSGEYEPPVVSEKSDDTVKSDEQTVTKTEPVQTTEAIKLPSATKPKSYFAKINEDIVKNVEMGSPSSISAAMSQMWKVRFVPLQTRRISVSIQPISGS